MAARQVKISFKIPARPVKTCFKSATRPQNLERQRRHLNHNQNAYEGYLLKSVASIVFVWPQYDGGNIEQRTIG